MAAEPQPLYCVYRAGDRSTVCYRVVSQNPAQVGDFLSFMDSGTGFDWRELHRATGASHWEGMEEAAALARRKGLPWLAAVDLSQADPRTPWAHTGARGHVTIWAPPSVILAAVVDYMQV